MHSGIAAHEERLDRQQHKHGSYSALLLYSFIKALDCSDRSMETLLQQFQPPQEVSLHHVGYFVVLIALVLAVRMYRHWPKQWDEVRDGDFQQAFLAQVAQEERWSMVQRETLSKILTSWTEQDCGGVILVEIINSSTQNMKKICNGKDQDQSSLPIPPKPRQPNKYQVISFNTSNGPAKFRQLPMIQIKWAYTSTLPRAQALLKKGIKVEIIDCKEDVFRQIFQHLASYCHTDDETHMATGCRIYEGYLSPVY